MNLFLRLTGLCLLLATSVQAAQTQPRIVADAASVSGFGFTPDHTIVIFGAANVPQPFVGRLINYLQFVVVDQAGSFRWQAPTPISPVSIWIAVDTRTADYAVAAPAVPDPPDATLLPPRVLSQRDTGNDALSIDEYFVNLLVVRPNDAVWIGSSMRHSPADLNRGLPGAMQFSLRQLKSVSEKKHELEHLTPADFVVIIDPISLRFFAGRPVAN